ncbi:25S rRNA (uracil2843-N3)-methyltransferase [Aspergillus saccharolyticus JOP 1030-1]|uniref:25S rRNA (Uridine(2843)-N(3))-methyltransferase n=1 Tax=Aspergillus saccharolyticus JOP 1030-1 TaxID=1450539 RepID=A0A318ZNZ8_9EURO|nr:hypothetical protein BP01DRAFT_146569 [Aspergillus saccharolyticus JOP 1030-1]PYH48375.1 hypothetical protein BP01DRAFT_146569 [Aspergillus saccharolyticus JOP 1030-1]
MVSSRQGPSKKSAKAPHGRASSKSDQKKPPRSSACTQGKQRPQDHLLVENWLDSSATIPLTLQQLLLNVFKSALLTYRVPSCRAGESDVAGGTSAAAHAPESTEQPQLDIKGLIQTIKSHLYNRDFNSAFTDADEDLLRAYALRWSSSRALGYAGIFRALWAILLKPNSQAMASANDGVDSHVVCIGGGAGAEIVALAAAWRDWTDAADGSKEQPADEEQATLSAAVGGLSVHDEHGTDAQSAAPTVEKLSTTDGQSASERRHPRLSVTAIDIADWSSIVGRLVSTIRSPAVAGSNSHPAPLCGDAGLLSPDGQPSDKGLDFQVGFQRLDVLSASEDELRRLLHPREQNHNASTVLVTLMFTLNELFSTSMAKATGFLLRLTDLLQPGAVLLVVDSPGSYSTLKLGKSSSTATGASANPSERQYPMKFLLDHALLTVAAGKWDRLFSQDSRWWRRDAARLRYGVGEGAGLEDMRFQIHIYRRSAD